MLAASTPNDGSETSSLPNTPTKHARIKVEAVGNVFFDISNADFTITIPGVVGLDSLGFSGSNLIDSYDSANGPYGGANQGANGERLLERLGHARLVARSRAMSARRSRTSCSAAAG